MTTTPTATADREAARRMTEIDLGQLAQLREERWETRRARIEADPTLDPRIKRWYLDRTPQNTQQTSALLGVTPQRVSAQRETSTRSSVRSRRRQQPHPSLIPTMDTVEGMLAGVPDPGVELGVLIEWAVMGGRCELDADTGTLTNLIKTQGPQTGRVRVTRTTMSRPAPKPRKDV